MANTSFEEKVLNMLTGIVRTQEEIQERLDEIEEGLRNVSTPGSNYSVFNPEED